MANRIAGNVYIIDSAGAGNSLIVGSASWSQHQMKIHTVSFWSSNTTGVFEMVYASNTANTAFILTNPNHFAATVDLHFGEATNFEELRCKSVTAGTGFLYLA